jgi:type IV secretory pathway TraG/TraD family ATPase VirD4
MSVTLGRATIWGCPRPVELKRTDRSEHVHILGKTGTGKSTLMKNLLVQDIHAGEGVALIDPHGDLARDLLDFIPPARLRDVIYFDPSEYEYPIGINLLENVPRDARHLVASNIVSVLHSMWADVWGTGRMQHILSNTLLALLECGNSTFLGVTRMYSDERYRAKVLKKVKDPEVRAFWIHEFADMERKNERLKIEAISPIQNKVEQFFTPPLRNIFGQVTSAFSFRYLIDHQKIFIANLAKGKIGEDKANILGSFLVAQLQLAAMSRADIPEGERAYFYLYVDEFQNFCTASFASILSEMRKYRLCLTLAHQYIDQLKDKSGVKEAIYGNVGTLLCFRVGAQDADYLREEFAPYQPTALTSLDKFMAYVKLCVDGATQEPLLLQTLPPHPSSYGNREYLMHYSRKRYGTPRATVEAKIARWYSKGNEDASDDEDESFFE